MLRSSRSGNDHCQLVKIPNRHPIRCSRAVLGTLQTFERATEGMARARYSPTERIGVGEVGQIVQRDLGWIFREQPVADVGIDAHIEQVDGSGFPTGKLVGAQIKSGASHVRRAGDALVYYGKL